MNVFIIIVFIYLYFFKYIISFYNCMYLNMNIN